MQFHCHFLADPAIKNIGEEEETYLQRWVYFSYIILQA
jgi:hypothetical protein